MTGSKYLVTPGKRRVLVDCGLFQGLKELRLRNWAPLPVRPESIDAVILTHAHLDHSGYLPIFVRDGFPGRVFCSGATADLCSILLPDSGRIQEEDAEYANKKRFSKHHPAKPLYTETDAQAALARMTPLEWGRELYLGDGLTVKLSPAGHMLGAAIVQITGDDGRVVFSGDLGRPNDPLLVAPSRVPAADYLGMLTGGRVLHHLKAFGPDAKNTIILVGYQAEGTRGAALARGA